MPSPASLTWLIARLSKLIASATDSLEAQYPDGVDAWQQEVERQLARYHGAAMLAGSDVGALTPAMATAVTTDLAEQLRFFRKFGGEVQDGKEWSDGWNARANLYAGAISKPYWRGKTKMLPLPAMPTEGTTCMSNCKCGWNVQQLDGDENYDAYWILGDTDDHCQICPQRAQDWSPVQIREGVLQL